jgi:hypothetical protein
VETRLSLELVTVPKLTTKVSGLQGMLEGVREKALNWHTKFKLMKAKRNELRAECDAMAKKADRFWEFIEKKYGEKKISHQDYLEALYGTTESKF